MLFLLALLLPWASVSVDGGAGIGTFSESQNGFGSGLLTFAWILLIAAAVLALLPATSANVRLPFPVGSCHTVPSLRNARLWSRPHRRRPHP